MCPRVIYWILVWFHVLGACSVAARTWVKSGIVHDVTDREHPLRITWTSELGKIYAVEATPELHAPWQRVQEIPLIASARISNYRDRLDRNYRFYRVMALEDEALLYGQVKEAAHGQPMAKVMVAAAHQTVFTDAEGYYYLSGLKAGPLDVDFASDVQSGSIPLVVRFQGMAWVNSARLTVVANQEGFTAYTNYLVRVQSGRATRLDFNLQANGDGQVGQNGISSSQTGWPVQKASLSDIRYQWDFGDGTGSEELDPVKVYSTGGIYDVSLQVWTSDNPPATVTKRAYIQAIAPPTIIQSPTNQVAVAGATVTFIVRAQGSPPLSYQWFKGGVALTTQTNITLVLNEIQSRDAGEYQVTVSNSAGMATSSPATLTILSAPVILTQPQSQTVNQGTEAVFNVTAIGSPPLSYQWWKGMNLIPSATNDSLTLAQAQLTDAGEYKVAVSNMAGTVTSGSATLFIQLVPAILSSPTSQKVNPGEGVEFSVSATGTQPLHYQWYKDGSLLAGEIYSTLTITQAQPVHVGSYTVMVSNAVGSVTSAPAWLTLSQVPVISVQPASRMVSAGSDVVFNVSATGEQPLYYQWQFKGIPLPGRTEPMLFLTRVQSDQEGEYSVVVSNSYGAVTSSVAQLIVSEAPRIILQPQDTNASPGMTVTFRVAATGSRPLAYQWYHEATLLPGATNASLVFTNVQAAQAGFYSVVVSNTAGFVTSVPVALRITLLPVITTQPVDQTVKQGGQVTFTVVASSPLPLRYQWLKDGTNLPSATLATFTLTNAQPSQAGYYAVVVSNDAGAVTSDPALLSVWEIPRIVTPPQSLQVFLGDLALFTVVAAGQPLPTYQWFKGAAIIPGATNDALVFPSAQLNDTATYSVVVSNAAGAVTNSANLTVTSPPVITVQPQSTNAIAGTTVTFTVSATGTLPLSYQWYKEEIPISGATNATLILTNVQPQNVGAYYFVIISNALGSVTSAPVFVNVDP